MKAERGKVPGPNGQLTDGFVITLTSGEIPFVMSHPTEFQLALSSLIYAMPPAAQTEPPRPVIQAEAGPDIESDPDPDQSCAHMGSQLEEPAAARKAAGTYPSGC